MKNQKQPIKQKQNQKQHTTKSKAENSFFPEPQFYGTAVVGTKGQIVIPKDLRDASDIKTGDMVVLFLGKGGVIAMMKADQLNKVLKNSADLFKL
jgi:AbrB family looped-hinge helix DNA binding protein